MKVSVNRDLCSGHAMCVVYCPEVFSSDDHGFCVVENADVPSDLEDKARTGVMACPEGALRIEGE